MTEGWMKQIVLQTHECGLRINWRHWSDGNCNLIPNALSMDVFWRATTQHFPVVQISPSIVLHFYGFSTMEGKTTTTTNKFLNNCNIFILIKVKHVIPLQTQVADPTCPMTRIFKCLLWVTHSWKYKSNSSSETSLVNVDGICKLN